MFVAVNLFTAYCVWRFRHRKGNTAHYEPESKKLEIILTAFTTVGVAAMLTPGLFVWGEFVTVPADATSSRRSASSGIGASVSGRRRPARNSDVRHMTVDNPLGVDPEDPDGPGRRGHRGTHDALPVNQS